MTEQPHSDKPAVAEVPSEITQLMAVAQELPPEVRVKLDAALNRVYESSKRRRRILGLVQDALSQLRLDMKYLMFDLEATRRERDDYRSQLEGSSQDP